MAHSRWSRNLRVALAAVLVVVVVPTLQASAAPQATAHAPKATTTQFRMDMRKLWEDHITWTRVVIISAAADLPDFDVAVARLLQNQTDLGNAIKPFYGTAAGDQLTALLNVHITTAAEILAAAKAGDDASLQDALTRWYANADEIAAFLHQANPRFWPLADLQQMMKEHLDLTLDEAVARLSGDWAADVAAYDAVHVEILMMADVLSEGIIGQFPQHFVGAR